MIDTTLASDCIKFTFQKNSFRKILKLMITIDDQTMNEKVQYDINREAGKTSSL